MAPVPTQPVAESVPSKWDLMSPTERRIRQRFGLYTGIGVQVTMREKANWYVKKFGIGKGILLAAATVATGLPVWAGTTIPKPANQVWAGGTPRTYAVHTFKVKTVTNLRAGVFVRKDTTDEEIQAANAGVDTVGVMAERNWTQPNIAASTAPTAGDKVDVLFCGSGAWAKVRNGANLAMGVNIATSATGRSAAAIIAALGDWNKNVGKTLMDHDGSGAEGDIVVILGGA